MFHNLVLDNYIKIVKRMDREVGELDISDDGLQDSERKLDGYEALVDEYHRYIDAPVHVLDFDDLNEIRSPGHLWHTLRFEYREDLFRVLSDLYFSTHKLSSRIGIFCCLCLIGWPFLARAVVDRRAIHRIFIQNSFSSDELILIKRALRIHGFVFKLCPSRLVGQRVVIMGAVALRPDSLSCYDWDFDSDAPLIIH
jgi:hypothetical protein